MRLDQRGACLTDALGEARERLEERVRRGALGARKSPAKAGLVPYTDAFAARGGWHRSIVYRWIASKQIPPHVAWIVSLLLERRMLSDQLSAPAE